MYRIHVSGSVAIDSPPEIAFDLLAGWIGIDRHDTEGETTGPPVAFPIEDPLSTDSATWTRTISTSTGGVRRIWSVVPAGQAEVSLLSIEDEWVGFGARAFFRRFGMRAILRRELRSDLERFAALVAAARLAPSATAG